MHLEHELQASVVGLRGIRTLKEAGIFTTSGRGRAGQEGELHTLSLSFTQPYSRQDYRACLSVVPGPQHLHD